MSIEATSAKPQSPSAKPMLSQGEATVRPGSGYRVRVAAFDIPDKAGPRALVARIRFVDADGNEVAGPYAGCFESERHGQYIYLPTVAFGEAPSAGWSAATVTAPAAAASINVSVFAWRASASVSVDGPPEVAAAAGSLADLEVTVNGGFAHCLHVALADDVPSDRAAIVQVVYTDAEGQELPGPYEGCNHSSKHGHFAYAGTAREGAKEVRLLLRPPQQAVRARISVRRWKGTDGLQLVAEPRLVAELADGIQAPGEWLPVGARGTRLPLVVPEQARGRYAVLSGQYDARSSQSGSPALRAVCEYLDAEGRPILDRKEEAGVVAEPLLQFGGVSEARSFSCIMWCPENAASARLRLYRGDSVRDAAIHRMVELSALDTDGAGARDMHARLGVARKIEITRPAFAEWRLRVAFEGLRVAPEGISPPQTLTVLFQDASGRPLSLTGCEAMARAGRVQRAGTALQLTASTVDAGGASAQYLSAALEVVPPPAAASVVVRIDNEADVDLAYACSVHPCDALLDSRLLPASITNAKRVEEQDAEAARVMVQRLLDAHPVNPDVLSGALDVLRRLGDATAMRSVARRALDLHKPPGKLRFKARHVLAALQEQDPAWTIDVPGAWRGQARARADGAPLRVAHLFKTSVPYENTGGAIRCLNMVKFQKQAGMEPIVVTPFGYPARNTSGQPWEMEEIEGVPHYRLNGISREDLRTIPSTRQLEYTALLTAHLLKDKNVDVVQASSGYRGYEQALVGMAVAHKLGVPFVYEVRSYHEHTWRPMAGWVLDAEFTLRRMAQEDRCMREADAVVTICETMKEGLVARGIPAEKIFVVPNSVDLDKFQPVEPDPDLRARIGLRDGLVAGYISNVSAREGHDVLLRAVALARVSGAELQCLIVGRGPQLDALRLLALELGIADSVVFTGEVPHDEIPSYYALIDIFVVPRVADFASDFVTPMKPLEAMAMRRPLIVSDRPALHELVPPGVRGLEFDAGCPRALSAALLTLAQSEGQRQTLAEAGFSWVTSERSWPAAVDIYKGLYLDLLAER